MGGWKRAHNDAAPGNDASGGGDDDGAPRLPPLQLGLVGDDAPASPVADRSPAADRRWRRWLVVGLALAVGVAGGVVGANARHEAAESARVELIGGQTSLSRPAIPGTGTRGWQAEFLVFNPGERTVQVVDVAVAGWTRATSAEPVTAHPGAWTAFRAGFTPDCEVEPTPAEAEGALAAEAVVRSRGTEATVSLQFEPSQSWLRSAWASACRPRDVGPPDIAIASIQMLAPRDGIMSVRARLDLTTADGTGTAAVSGVWSHVPGFGFAVAGLPTRVAGTDVAEIELEWEVASCAIVERLDEARLSFHLTDHLDPTVARLQTTAVPAAILVALGRLSAQVCGL